MVQRRSFFCQL